MPSPTGDDKPTLAQCAMRRKTPLGGGRCECGKSKCSAAGDCTVHVRLSEPMHVWCLDHHDIEEVAREIGGKICDFAAFQDKNPRDGKSHLVLVECKKRVRGDQKWLEDRRDQLAGGLVVLREIPKSAPLTPDRVVPILVYKKGFVGAVRKPPMLTYNGRRIHIRIKRSGVVIDDHFVAKGKG